MELSASNLELAASHFKLKLVLTILTSDFFMAFSHQLLARPKLAATFGYHVSGALLMSPLAVPCLDVVPQVLTLRHRVDDLEEEETQGGKGGGVVRMEGEIRWVG